MKCDVKSLNITGRCKCFEITTSCRYGHVACTFTRDKIFTSFSGNKTPLKVLLALMLMYKPLLRWCNTNCRLEITVYALLSPKVMFHTVSTECMPKLNIRKRKKTYTRNTWQSQSCHFYHSCVYAPHRRKYQHSTSSAKAYKMCVDDM